MTASNAPPPRTGRTRLSDAELLILDALFDGGRPSRMLSAEQYSRHMNCMWTHDLSDDALIYWRTFSNTCCLSTQLGQRSDDDDTDWAEYERQRCWWRDIIELNSLRQ